MYAILFILEEPGRRISAAGSGPQGNCLVYMWGHAHCWLIASREWLLLIVHLVGRRANLVKGA